MLDGMLPEVQQLATVAMGALGDDALRRLLDLLEAVRTSIDEMPDELPPPQPRRTPERLRRT